MKRTYKITTDVLNHCYEASMRNAESLLLDATTLYENDRIARAFFLATASIEESGKAALAYTGAMRNLENEAVQSRLRTVLADHSYKKSTACLGLLALPGLKAEAIEQAGNLMLHLTRGRGLSMYVDVREDGELSIPDDVVRSVAARDAIRLARQCKDDLKQFVDSKQKWTYSEFDDRFFAIEPKKLMKTLNSEGFAAYLLDAAKNLTTGEGLSQFTRIAVTYYESLR